MCLGLLFSFEYLPQYKNKKGNLYFLFFILDVPYICNIETQ